MNFLASFFSWVRRSLDVFAAAPAHLQKSYTAAPALLQKPQLTPHGNSVPEVIHQIMTLDWLPVDGRLIVVGDVHGCLTQLKKLLNKLSYKSHKDSLIFVGDLVNKGPNSPGVIDLAMSSGAVSVRGNHDDSALQAYRDPASLWNQKPKHRWVKEMSEHQANYLNDMPFTVTLPELNIVVVHAGCVPGIPLEQQKLVDLYKMRFLRQRGTGWEGLESSDGQCVQWATEWNGPEHVIFGHDAMSRLQLGMYATGLDAGCVYGGALAACVIPAGKLIHQNKALHASCQRSEEGSCVIDPTAENLEIKIHTVPGNHRHHN